jgi:hypothetical protein
MGPRVGLDGCRENKVSRIHLVSNPEPSSPWRVAIPIALSRPSAIPIALSRPSAIPIALSALRYQITAKLISFGVKSLVCILWVFVLNPGIKPSDVSSGGKVFESWVE